MSRESCGKDCANCPNCCHREQTIMPESPVAGGIPLTMSKVGETVSIVRMSNNRDVAERLRSIGFAIGTKMRIIRMDGKNITVDLDDSRVVMDDTLASKIFYMPM